MQVLRDYWEKGEGSFGVGVYALRSSDASLMERTAALPSSGFG